MNPMTAGLRPTQTIPFDPTVYFSTDDAQLSLIRDALDSGDAGYIANAIGMIAKARGMTEVANETGFSRTTLHAALSESGNPTLETVTKVLASLGLKLTAERVEEAA